MAGPEETSEIQLQITSDGRQLVSEGYQGTEAWDLSSGRPLWVRPAPGRCEQIAIATAIDSVLCATDDSRVQAFDLATGGVTTNRFDYQLGIVSGINVSGDGDLLVEVGGPSLGLWRLDGSGPITKRILHGTGVVPQEFVTPNELLVGDVNPATGGAINPRLVDARTGAVIDSLRGVALATTTPVSGRLLALLPDGSTGLYDLATHQLVRSTRSRAPFVPDNTAKSDHALYASHGGEMRAINLRTGALLPMLVREKAPIFGIDVDPTGAHLLTGEDGSALQPRTSTGLRSGEPIPGTVAAVGTQLTVVASEAGTMTVLNSATYAPQGPPIPPITGLVDQLVIAHDQVRMLVVGRDGSIRIADLSSRQYIGDALNFGSATVGPVAFRADGDSLAFASANGIVVWTIDPTTMLRAACRVASRDITAEEWRTYFADLGPYRHAC
jgi:hypothetical protein